MASQILGMDLQRKAMQEQEIKDLEAAQAQMQRQRAEALVSPFQVGAETLVGQMGMQALLEAGLSDEEKFKFFGNIFKGG